MSKMKKSVKVLLISLVAVVCVLAIVLGCIFGLKDNRTPLDLDKIKSLANNIKINNEQDSFVTIDELAYQDICETSELTDYGDKYFIFNRDNKDSIYIYNKITSGQYEYKNLTDLTNNGGFVDPEAISYSIDSVNDEYFVLSQEFLSEESSIYENKIISVIYFGDYENPTEIYRLDGRGIYHFNGESVKLTDEFFAFYYLSNRNQQYNTIDITVSFYKLQPTIIEDNDESFNKIELLNYNIYDIMSSWKFEIFNSSLYFAFNDGIKSELNVVYLNDGEFESYKKIDNYSDTVFNVQNIAKDTLFVEQEKYTRSSSEVVNTSVLDDGLYINYSYFILDFNSENIEKSLQLEENFAKATTVSNDKLEYIYICEQKIGENNTLVNEYKSFYFDKNLNKVIEYNSLANENVLYALDTNFLTINNLLSFAEGKSKVIRSLQKTTGDEEIVYNLETNNNFSDLVVVSGSGSNSNLNYGVMNINGNFLIDPLASSYTNIYSIQNNYAIAADNLGDYYILNLNANTSTKIEDFYVDSNFLTLIQNGMPAYLTQIDDNITLYSLNGSILFENIQTINYSSTNSGVIVELISQNDENYFIKFISSNKIIFNGLNIQKLEYIDNYNSNFADNDLYINSYADYNNISIVDLTYGDVGTASYSGSGTVTITLTMNIGYYLEGISFSFKFWNTYTIGFSNFSYGQNNVFSMTTDDPSSALHGATWSASVNGNYQIVYKIVISNTAFMDTVHGFQSSSISTNLAYYNYYYISYNLNGGSYGSDHPNTARYSSWFYVDEPTRPGYSFSYWYVGNDPYYMTSGHEKYFGINSPQEDYIVPSNVIGDFGASRYQIYHYFKNLRCDFGTVQFKANWSVRTYYINYNLNGGTHGSVHPTSLTYDTTTYVSAPTKTGYTFTGWTISNMTTDVTHYFGTSSSSLNNSTTSSSYTISLSSTSSLYFRNLRSDSGTVTFTANWQVNTYEIKYDLDGGSWPSGASHPTTADYDEWFYVTLPIKTGYTFIYWYVGNDYIMTSGHEKYFGINSPQADYTVPTNVVGTSGGTKIYQYFKNLRSDDGTVDLQANWRANVYNINYVLGGGSLSSPQYLVTYDSWFQVSNPTRTGYTFTGWTISGMTSGVTHYIGTTTTSYFTSTATSYTTTSTSYRYFKNLGTESGQDITFTANWNSRPYYISYSLNASGASLGANSPTTVYYDSWFQVSNPTRTGYTFTGWTITNMTSGLTHRFGTSTSSYVTNSSSSYTNSTTSRTYYYNLNSGYGRVYFSAGWSVNTYYIEYDENGGTLGESRPGSAKFDSWFNISAPSSVPVGYYYDGWIVSDASTDCTHYYGTSNSSYSTTRASTFNVGTNQLYFQNLHSQNGATVTLTINWHPYTYNIGYNLNGGEHGQYHPETAEYNANVTISNPTRAGYTFTGWSFSGLNDECTHYFYYGSSWVAFTSTNGRYTDEVNVNYDRIVNATRFKNLGIEGGALVLTANWSANYYNITYHFLPASYDIVDDSIDTINTAGNMTATKTQRVRYDFNFKAYVSSVNALNSNEIELPQGVKLLFWVVNNTGSTYSSTTNLVSWNGDNTIATPISGKSINAGQEEIYSSANGYAPRNIHIYAAYTFVDITIQYMVASSENSRNDLSNYSTYSTDETTYNSNYHLLNILSSGINGWLITPNHYDFGTLTEDSITTYTFDGTYYEATVGSDIFWIFSNTSAYDSENPVYYAYAVYYGEGANGYYITFESDDFDLSSLGYENLWVTYDEWVNIPSPSRLGYTFGGWDISGMDTSTHYYGSSQSSYSSTTATTLSTNSAYFKNLRSDFAQIVTFKPIWQLVQYTVSYVINGGTYGSSHPTTVNYNAWFVVSIPTKTGYTFSGWSISGMTSGVTHYFGTSETSYVTSTGTTYSTNASYTRFRYLNSNSGTVTFNAKWSVNTYNISYSLGGGSFGTYHPTSATFNSWFQVSSPTRTGYTFNGWTISGMTNGLTHRFGTNTSSYVTSTGTSYTNSTTSRTYYYNLGSNSGQTVIFTADWTANTYTISVDYGNGTIKNYTAIYDEWLQIDTPTKAGYVFDGFTKITGCTDDVTHYIGYTASTSDSFSFTGESKQNIYARTYFLNMRSSSGTVTVIVRWKTS